MGEEQTESTTAEYLIIIIYQSLGNFEILLVLLK